MAAEEERILVSVDAENNPLYYNKSNRGNYGAKKDLDYISEYSIKEVTNIVSRIYDKIVDKKYDIYELDLTEFL